MIRAGIAAPAGKAHREPGSPERPGDSRLQHLLHGLNQPLTGLQCSMEVALAAPRSTEYYCGCLRDGLGLTERMRILVGAIRELMDAEVEHAATDEIIDLGLQLSGVVDELLPLAETRAIQIVGNYASLPANGSLVRLRMPRKRLGEILFRLLESAISSAAASDLKIQVNVARNEVFLRIEWQEETGVEQKVNAVGGTAGEPSRAELSWILAEAGLERCGASLIRGRRQGLETMIVGFPRPA